MKNNLNGSLNFAYKLPAFVTINLKVTRNLYMNYITHYFHYKKYHKVLLHLFGYTFAVVNGCTKHSHASKSNPKRRDSSLGMYMCKNTMRHTILNGK